MELQDLSCALCGGKAFRTVLEISQPDRFEVAMGVSSEGYKRDWVECLGCGLFSNVLRRKDISGVYRDAYYSKEVEKESVSEKFQRILGLPAEQSDNHFRVQRICHFVRAFRKTCETTVRVTSRLRRPV